MKILIATGGSKHSNEAVHTGAVLARATDSPITILTVIKEPGKRSRAQAIIDRAMALVQTVFDDPGKGTSGIGVETKIRLGYPAEEIVHEAGEGNYDLIVVGTWPKQSLFHRLLAPTTERILMQAPCPVLIAKGKLGSLDHVLLCVSGADTSSKASGFLREMATQMTGLLNITLLHVMSQISASPEIRESWQLEASAEKLMLEGTPEGQWLNQEIKILEKTGARLQPKVRHGLVVDEVLMEALNGDCDLLVIGAHRQSGWQRLLLDDLTHQIVVRCDRPVLVV